MSWLILGILVFGAMFMVFPATMIEWSRKVRRMIRDDLRQRVTTEEWEKLKDDFADL